MLKKKNKPKLKDYLNQEESFQLLKAGKFIADLEQMITAWSERGNLTSDEIKWGKMARSWGFKMWDSIFNRQTEKTKNTFVNRVSSMYVRVTDGVNEKLLTERLNEQVNTVYEKEERFFNLCEISMHYLCQECTRCNNECHLYDFLENNFIAEPTGAGHYEGKKCRYGYKKKEGKMI